MHAVEQEHELVAAEPRGEIAVAARDVDRAHHLRQDAAHLDEQRVAGVVAERVVDLLEAVEIEEHHGVPAARIVPEALDAGGDLVVEQHAVRKRGERIEEQLAFGALSRIDLVAEALAHGLEREGRVAGGRLARALLHERAHDLPRFGRVDGLAQQQELRGSPEFLRDAGPRIRGALGRDHDLELGIDLPEPLDRLDAVPAARHAHVDDRDRVRLIAHDRGLQQLEAVLGIPRRIDDEADAPVRGLVRRRGGGAEDRAVGLVQRGLVVDHEDAMELCAAANHAGAAFRVVGASAMRRTAIRTAISRPIDPMPRRAVTDPCIDAARCVMVACAFTSRSPQNEHQKPGRNGLNSDGLRRG
ncbi:MAG: hypothetical protein NTU45_01240 [Planctomycetota bacterium]|nr:hypothetical protein [Planctomycetota bacterium]